MEITALRRAVAMYGHRGYTPDSQLGFEATWNDWQEAEVLSLFEAMDTSDYHISCGPMSYLLRDVYRALGYPAATYNFGFSNTSFTHEVTFVQLPDGRVSWQDATFNTQLLGADGELLDAFEWLSGERQGSFQEDTTWVRLLVDASVLTDSHCQPVFVGEQVGELASGVLEFDFRVSFSSNVYDPCYGFMTKLHEELDTAISYHQLARMRISDLLGAPDWQERVGQITLEPVDQSGD